MSELEFDPERRIALFQRKEIRRIIHNNEWWFVVEDAVLALIESRDPKQYIQRMKQRDLELAKGWVQIVRTLSVATRGGTQPMLCANTEGLFRIIQSIPSPKAEPFKRWLARIGYERIPMIFSLAHSICPGKRSNGPNPMRLNGSARARSTRSTRMWSNGPLEPSPGLSVAMPWDNVPNNQRPERARET